MLRVGLTGGIGAGKSTVARRLVERGAVLVDADVLAREVVARGSDGLAAVVAAFGTQVLLPGGDLDRPALGRRVFGDEQARATLNGIVHPLVAARRTELVAAAPRDAVVVEDVPLLVETGQAPRFPLVVVVEADVQERVRRLVADRGMAEDDARARTAAQASDAERRAAADVLLPNPRRTSTHDPLPALVDALWDDRLVPFAANLLAGRPAARPEPAAPGDRRAEDTGRAARVLARVAHVAGARALALDQVPPAQGREPADAVVVRVVVADLATARALAGDLAAAGLVPDGDRDPAGAEGVTVRSADPGLAVVAHLQPAR